MPLLPNQVQLPQDLSSVFSGIGNQAYNQIGANYGAAGGKATFDPSMGGPGSGITDYQRQRLGTTQGLDIGNLEAGLGGKLGNAGYQNQIAARNYGQQRQLADIIGGAMAPTTLQEIFQGIGAGGRTVGQLAPFAGMFGGGGSLPSNATSFASTPSPLSLMPEDYSGFENYGFPGYGGGF